MTTVTLAHHKKELMMVQDLQRHMKDPVILLGNKVWIVFIVQHTNACNENNVPALKVFTKCVHAGV